MDEGTIGRTLAEWGEKPFRARQIAEAKRAGARTWDDVTTLSKPLRQRLAAVGPLWSVTPDERLTSRDGTVKWRLMLGDGRLVEAVLIAHAQGRRTLCVSSQVGCALACRFCATGSMGFGRDLDANEIVEQGLIARHAAEQDGARLSNVVFMGMGEPMQNLPAVLEACAAFHAEEGLGISARSIAISTAGWVPGIEALSRHPLPVRLALSLHAADDQTRGRLMPINARYPIANVLAACRRYCDRTGRRVFIEYLLLDGVNDSAADARNLAALLRDGRFHVNLIEYNPTDGGYVASPVGRRETFVNALANAGIDASVRRSRGADVDAACGQLAARGPSPGPSGPVGPRRT
ncbi:MAG: 23S rRNA (adenine(2503)-C(2))-methyltransferase RlmN [Thermoleophilia bacterium]|nr:23S rRNA (adenine(2503)-C(2))-methyltransferase RlmN [Thermoleophilia bacterium]